MIDLFTFVFICVIICILYHTKTWIKVAIATYGMPSPPSVPVLGHALLATDSKKLKEIADTVYQNYGRILKIWFGLFPAIFVFSPEYLQKIVCGSKHTDKMFIYHLMDDYLGQGLVTLNGQKWRTHRKLLQPCFHISVLEKFIDVFHNRGKLLSHKFQDMAQPVNITSHINKCILDILHDVVFGISPEEIIKLDLTDESPFRSAKVTVPYRISRPWLLLDSVYNTLQCKNREEEHRNSLKSFAQKLLKRRREELLKSGETHAFRNSLLDMMINISYNNGDTFDDNDISDEMCTFMLAGQESVSTASAFCLYLLAKHQDIQNRVQRELDDVFDNSDRIPTLSDLRELQYLEQCIKETLRLYPSLPILGRTLSEDVTLGKYKLPAGCTVFLAPYSTHRIPHIYPDPEKFDPERFTPDKEASRHSYAYIPFSAGPRNCIGYKFAMLEMKTVISSILRRHSVTLSSNHKEFTLTYRVTLRASGGIWLNFIQRQENNKCY